jgi:hypothetical protein
VYGFSKRQDLADAPQFLPYIQDTILQNVTLGHKGQFDIYQQSVPLLKYKNQQKLAFEGFLGFLGFSNLYDTTSKYKGYRGNNYTWNKDFESFKKRFPKGAKYRFDKEVVRQFEEYLAFCQQENIKVVLVYAPEYFEVQPYYKNKPELIKLCQESVKKYNCQFLDYSKNSLCYNRDYFYNSQHLNRTGAELFTLDLGKRIRTILHD